MQPSYVSNPYAGFANSTGVGRIIFDLFHGQQKPVRRLSSSKSGQAFFLIMAKSIPTLFSQTQLAWEGQSVTRLRISQPSAGFDKKTTPSEGFWNG